MPESALGGTVLATPCHPETEGYSDVNRADGNLGRYAEASLAIVQYRTEILVADAVVVEPVSITLSLLTGKLTGNFAE